MTHELASRWRPLRVRSVVEETADAKSIVFDVPAELAQAFHYRPGQFLTLRLPVAGRHLPRCYSMSSAPAVDDAPRVTVKRVDRGRGSNWLCDHAEPGLLLDVLPRPVSSRRARSTATSCCSPAAAASRRSSRSCGRCSRRARAASR